MERVSALQGDQQDLEDLTYEQLCELGTNAQAIADRCLNEIERRGLLTFKDGAPVVPFDVVILTVLTR
jgi:hypothetical protein